MFYHIFHLGVEIYEVHYNLLSNMKVSVLVENSLTVIQEIKHFTNLFIFILPLQVFKDLERTKVCNLLIIHH